MTKPEGGFRRQELHETIPPAPIFEIFEVGNNPDYNELADYITTGEYRKSFSPNLSFEEVKSLICNDPYGTPHRAIRLLAFETDQKSAGPIFAGAIRVGIGQEHKEYPLEEEYSLETAALLEPQGGWGRMTAEVPMEESLELSRIVVAPWQRGPHNTPLVLQALLQASFATAARIQQREQRQFKRAYITLKGSLLERIQETDYIPNGPFPVTLQANAYATDTQTNFPSYWLKPQDPPLLCYFDIPPKMKQPVK